MPHGAAATTHVLGLVVWRLVCPVCPMCPEVLFRLALPNNANWIEVSLAAPDPQRVLIAHHRPHCFPPLPSLLPYPNHAGSERCLAVCLDQLLRLAQEWLQQQQQQQQRVAERVEQRVPAAVEAGGGGGGGGGSGVSRAWKGRGGRRGSGGSRRGHGTAGSSTGGAAATAGQPPLPAATGGTIAAAAAASGAAAPTAPQLVSGLLFHLASRHYDGRLLEQAARARGLWPEASPASTTAATVAAAGSSAAAPNSNAAAAAAAGGDLCVREAREHGMGVEVGGGGCGAVAGDVGCGRGTPTEGSDNADASCGGVQSVAGPRRGATEGLGGVATAVQPQQRSYQEYAQQCGAMAVLSVRLTQER